ncbi:MAG: FGGY-family carbohydrate kinase [Alphaproteobacteria bacterium]|nr:FGGY-family carbohydrate kinase [Alphaproteobacteria bacterium]
MADTDLVLGYDFGTSSVKAAIFAPDGTVHAVTACSYPVYYPQSGWVEQNPEDWWHAMCVATRQLLEQCPWSAGRIAAIGMAAQMCGVVPVDRHGQSLSNCLTWMDTRSADIARELMGGAISIHGYNAVKLAYWIWLTGGAPNLSGKDPISKYLWLKQQRPDIWGRVHKLLDVKDYLLHRCTGRFAATYDNAHLTWLFDARSGRKYWSDALLGRAGLDGALLPEVVRATDIAGALTTAAAADLGLRAGIPVAGGLGDLSAAAVGAGNPADGSLHLYIGTSAWFGAMLGKSRVDPLTATGSICFADGRDYLLIATQECAGASIRWGMETLGFGPDAFPAFEEMAAGAVRTRDMAMFFPWFAGERVPIDDERIRGGFGNLSLATDRAQVAFALYEGVALNARWAMRPFDRLSGRGGQTIRIVGGGARSRFWTQIFADVLGRPVQRVDAPELCGARGSAMAAAVAAGWYADLQSAAVMTHEGETMHPDPAASAFHSERFDNFATFYGRVRPWYWRYGAMGSPAQAD